MGADGCFNPERVGGRLAQIPDTPKMLRSQMYSTRHVERHVSPASVRTSSSPSQYDASIIDSMCSRPRQEPLRDESQVTSRTKLSSGSLEVLTADNFESEVDDLSTFGLGDSDYGLADRRYFTKSLSRRNLHASSTSIDRITAPIQSMPPKKPENQSRRSRSLGPSATKISKRMHLARKHQANITSSSASNTQSTTNALEQYRNNSSSKTAPQKMYDHDSGHSVDGTPVVYERGYDENQMV